MKKAAIFTAMLMALSVSFTGCEQQKSDGAGYSFDYAMAGYPESLDPQFAEDEFSKMIIGNLYTGLLQTDENGNINKGVAESYNVSSDGLSYTFKLRDNCYWFFDENDDDEVSDDECFSVTAHDFEFAFRRIFNPDTRSPHREKYRCIKNASSIISGSKDYTQIGVKAISDYELIFELEYESAEFLNSLTLTPAMPCNEEFFLSTKGRYGLDDDSIMSDGAFFVRQWFYDPYGNDNFVYMQRNLANTNYDRIFPTALNFYMKDTQAEVNEAFNAGESNVTLSFTCDDSLKEESNVRKYENYTLGIITNPENPRYSNLNIKKALAFGIDRESFDGEVSEDLTKAYGIIPPGITVNGKSYRELTKDKSPFVALHDDMEVEYNPELAKKYYQAGMKQMNLQSLENIKLLIPKNLMNTEYLHLVTQNWQTLFGFYIGIEEVPEDEFYSRIEERDYTLAVYPLTGDYHSPLSIIEQFTSKVNQFGFRDAKVDTVYDELSKLANYSKNLDKFIESERIILNNFEFIPVFYKSEYEIMGNGNDDIIYQPFTKQLFFRYAKYYE